MSDADHPTIGEWLGANMRRLESAGISSARLDCLILLEQRLPANRTHMLAHLDDRLTADVLKKLNDDIELRLQHKPVPYITGTCEFYGRQFIVSDDVLVPRPETEDMVTLLKTLPAPKTVIDVGTGSGCLAVTAKLEIPEARVMGIDIDEACLSVAKENAENLGADVEFIQGDLLSPLSTSRQPLAPIVILANLPYVPADYPVNSAARHEPKLALYGGSDGLNLYRTFWQQVGNVYGREVTGVICESLAPQHDNMESIAKRHGYQLQTTEGLQQLFIDQSGPQA